jgi:hypothetical protein
MRSLLLLFVAGFGLALFACERYTPVQADREEEPLDRPLKVSDFSEPETCGSCHPIHYEQWRTSMHAYAMTDPVFIAMNDSGQVATQGKLDQFCVKCHTPLGSLLGLTPSGFKVEDLPPVTRRGVSCEVCHNVKAVKEFRNGELEFAPLEARFGPIKDPVPNPFHKSKFAPHFVNADLCGACHNVVNAVGVPIEATHEEFLRSPAAAEGRTCQDCHMRAFQGPAAVGGPERTLHEHYFVGVDVALVDFPGRELQYAKVEELLRSAATISVTAPEEIQAGSAMPITVEITSLTDGHHLPTGAVADRQMWLAVTVTDATGRILYQSGHLDANGDLYDRHSEIAPNADFDLVVFRQELVTAEGRDAFFSWEAAAERTITLPPRATTRESYFPFIPADAQGPLDVEVKLRFRSFPPFLLRMLKLDELSRKIPIMDMDEWQGQVRLGS